jgi:DNA-binding LacI/PurR family transcriptional regulator
VTNSSLKRLPATDIKCYFVQLMGLALSELFCQGAMQKKPVIAFFDTIGMPPRENLYNIRHDRVAMAKLLVSHLKEVGHRRLIVGTRDVEAWEAQQVLRRRAPELAERIKFYGFLDTPWSRAGSPPFTTVSVNIPAMVEAAMDILDTLLAGKTPANQRITIEPKLVVR